jgi:hypothetical protein
VCSRACVCMRVRARNLACPACNAYAPYCDVICGPSVSITFFDSLINGAIFGKKEFLNIKCVLIFSTTIVWKYPLFLSGFNETWIFLTDFEKTKYQISSKSVQRESSCSMRTDRRMDRQTDRRKNGHDEANTVEPLLTDTLINEHLQ